MSNGVFFCRNGIVKMARRCSDGVKEEIEKSRKFDKSKINLNPVLREKIVFSVFIKVKIVIIYERGMVK